MTASAVRAGAEGEPQRLGLWLLLALSPFALAAGLHPGLLQTEAGFVAAWNVVAPAAAANIAAEPDIWRGLGSGALLPAQPLLLLGVPPAPAVQWVMLSCLLLGALGIYVWLQHHMGDRAAGLAALVYLFHPLTLASVYSRGSLGSVLLLALLPLALAGLSVHAEQRSLSAAGVAVVCLLWMVHVQAGLALIVLGVLALYAWLVERSGSALLIVLASAAAGLASLIPHWSIHGAPVSAGSYATLYGLLRDRGTAAEPVQIGIAALVLAAITVWGLATSGAIEQAARRLLWFAVAASALLFALVLPWSGWLWQWTRAGLLLEAPWQLALAAAPFLAAAGGGAALLLPELRRPAFYAALAATIVIASAPYRAPAYTAIVPPERPAAILGQNQVAILEATVRERAAGPAEAGRAELTLTWQVLRPLDFDANLFFQALDIPAGQGAQPEVVAQRDVAPVAATPATSWQAGDLFSETYTLDLPAGPGPLRYYVGLYDWRDGTRLPVNGGLDDKLVLYGGE